MIEVMTKTDLIYLYLVIQAWAKITKIKTSIYVPYLTKVCESAFQVSWKQYCKLTVQ